MRWWKETMAGKQTPPTSFKGPRKTWGGYRTWFAHLFGVKNERNEIFAFNLKMKKNKMSDSRVEERAQKFPFPVGKSTKWLVVRSVREVSPKIYSNNSGLGIIIFRTICRRFSFVVDEFVYELVDKFGSTSQIPMVSPNRRNREIRSTEFGVGPTGRTCQDGPSCLGGVVLFCQGVLKGETTHVEGLVVG